MKILTADIKAKIVVEEKKLDAAEEEFKAEVEKLQQKYQSLMEEKDAKAAEDRSGGSVTIHRRVKEPKVKEPKELRPSEPNRLVVETGL